MPNENRVYTLVWVNCTSLTVQIVKKKTVQCWAQPAIISRSYSSNSNSYGHLYAPINNSQSNNDGSNYSRPAAINLLHVAVNDAFIVNKRQRSLHLQAFKNVHFTHGVFLFSLVLTIFIRIKCKIFVGKSAQKHTHITHTTHRTFIQ